MNLQSKHIRVFTWVIIVLGTFLSYNVSADSDKRNDIFIQNIDEENVNFKKIIKGKATYLKLWASWCQDCLKQMPHMHKVYEKYQNNLNVIGVNVWINESLPSIKKVIQSNNITFPMFIDKSGELAQSFNLMGTPLHILIDANGNIIHKGHIVNEDLEQKLLFLATGKVVENTIVNEKNTLFDPVDNVINNKVNSGDTRVILFTSSWCDWYLEKSRPDMSKRCIQAQKLVNKLSKDNPNINVHIVLNRLWTGNKELNAYKEKYNISSPMDIDKTNQLFMKNKINNIPTLLIFKGDLEVFKISEFDESSYIQVNL